MSEKSGFFASLFDLSFTEFVTTKVIKLLFVLAIIFAALGTVALVIAGFAGGAVGGIISLILSPVVFFVYVLMSRIWLELVIVIFRIAENTGKMAEKA